MSYVDTQQEKIQVGVSAAGGFLSGALAGSGSGPWGMLIGALVGAGLSVGITLIKIKNFEPPEQEPPEPEKYKRPDADQGNPAPWAMARFMRLPGQIIYLGPIIPRKGLQSLPGQENPKFKADGTQANMDVYRYEADIALAWCRSPVLRVIEIYANGEVVWQRYIDGGFRDLNDIDNVQVRNLPGGETQIIIRIPLATWNALDKTFWRKDAILNVTAGPGGLTDNEGIYFMQGHYYHFGLPFVYIQFLVDVPNATAQSGPGPYSYSFQDWYVANNPNQGIYIEDIEHYPGDSVQDPDPWLVGNFDPGVQHLIPAFRGTAYTMVKAFNLTKWGSSVPRFEALCELDASNPRLDTVMRAIIERGQETKGVALDVSDLASADTLGYVMNGPLPIEGAVQELMMFYMLDVIETFAQSSITSETLIPQLKFFFRSSGFTWYIPIYEQGAREFGNEPGYSQQQITVLDGSEIPTHMVLDYIDAFRRFQVSSIQYAQEEGDVQRDTTAKLRTNLIMTAPIALYVARLLTWIARSNRDTFVGTLPPRWLALRPGDRLNWNPRTVTGGVEVRITSITRGQNGLIEFQGVIDDTLAYSPIQTDPWIPPPSYPPAPTPVPTTRVWDLPPLRAPQATTFGMYYHVRMPQRIAYEGPDYNPLLDVRDRFRDDQTALVVSGDDGATWHPIAQGVSEQQLGIISDTPLGPGVCYAWDTTNELIITSTETLVLSNATRDEVGAFRRNLAVVGNEVIGFTTVEDMGENYWKLTDLLRGQRGTEQYMDTHTVDEHVLIMSNGATLPQARLDPQYFNLPSEFLGVPGNMIIDDLRPLAVDATPMGGTLQPFAPRSKWLRRFEDGAIRLYFKARTRVPFRLLSGVVMPRVESQWCFRIDVFWVDAAAEGGREYIRTLCCCYGDDDEYYMTYTAAQQTEDFIASGRVSSGSLPYSYDFEFYQCSDTIVEFGRRSHMCTNKGGTYVQFEMCPPAS